MLLRLDRQATGLNLAQIALIEAISFLFSLAMELPWGVVTDRIGYRRAMILSCGAFFASKLVFWRADGFGDFLPVRFLLSAAIAGLSGVEESILYLSAGEAHGRRAFSASSALGEDRFAALAFTLSGVAWQAGSASRRTGGRKEFEALTFTGKSLYNEIVLQH